MLVGSSVTSLGIAVHQTEDLSTLLARLATNAENPAICKDILLTISVAALLT
jgi:hypothetical protein